MAISNCLFSPASENPRGFSVWCILVKLSTKPRNYSQPRRWHSLAERTKNEKQKHNTMKSYTKKALKSGIASAIGFGLITALLDYYNNDDFEISKLIIKTVIFTVPMGVYFNYTFKKGSEKESKK